MRYPPLAASAILALLLFARPAPLGAQMTETPETMGPGRLLVRMDAITVGLDREEVPSHTYTALALGTALVSTGLTQNLDVEAGAQLYLRQTYELFGSRRSNSGLGDVQVRVKWRFWSDPEWGAAAAVIPYLRVPTGSSAVGSKRAEGGVAVPWAMEVPGGIMTGAMFRWDVVSNDADDGYDSNWLLSGVARRNLTSLLGIYGEASLSASSRKGSAWAGNVAAGANLNLSRNFQWDYSLTRGLNSRATDWTHILRFRWRL